MMALLKRICAKPLLPIAWTLLLIILLCLPGSVIPGSGILTLRGLDKIAHVILFGGVVLFWGLYAYQRFEQQQKAILWITLSTILLGVALEFAQRYFIPNRSFDIKDIIADAAGALLAFACLVLDTQVSRKAR